MDDLIDDDFGDLYADVEVQATSAINSVENFVKHSQADGDVGNNTKESKDENPVLESELLDSIEETLGDYSDADGSDSEDNLNIVLNDEDCQRFSVAPRRNGHVGGYEEGKAEAMAEEEEKDTGGGGAFCTGPCDPNGYCTQYPRNKMVRHHGSSFPSGIKGIESVVAASCYWRSSGGDMEDNSRRKLKVSNSGQVGDRSAASRGRYGFSLPWDRTILDVDIDAFEDKGWRYPGVDLTDFFNFGFNEDSWRQYCISLEQFRQQSSYMNSRIQTCESSKLFQANGIGSEHERSAQDSEADNITQAESSSNSADRGEVLLKLLKGRAIQVEDGTGEHQPSMDSRCPSYWDSDVVIQINVIDSVENGSCSVKDKLGYTESSGLESSKRRDVTGDDSSCSVKDELGHTESIRLEVSKGRDITVDYLKDICYSEHASEDEVSIHSVEGNISCSQPVPESNKVHLDPEKVGDENDANQHCHQKVHAEASDNVSGAVETADKAEEKIVGDMCKSDPCLVETELAHSDRIHFGPSLSRSESYSNASTDSVYGSPIVYPSLIRRPSSYMELQDSLATDHKSPEKICARRNQGHRNNQGNKVPVGEGQKHQPGRHHRTAEWRIDRHDDEVFPMPRDKSPFSCNRRIGRMHDYHEGEHFSYSDQRDRFCGHHDYHQSFIDGIKLPNRRECSEEYFHKTSFRDDTQGVVDRDWHKRGRELPPEHMIPYTYREFRQLVSLSHSFKVRDMQWRSKTSNSQFQKRTNFDNCLRDPKNRKYLTIQEKCGRSSPFTKQRTDYVDKRGEHPSSFTGRELNPCGRRLRYNDGFPMNLENSRHVELEDDYWNLDHQHLPVQYCGVSDIPDEERWHGVKPPKSEMFESRFTERNGRYIRQIYHEECKGSGCVHGYDDDAYAEADIMHLGEVHFGRKYSYRSRVAHPSDDICAERNSYSHGKSSRHTRARAKYRSTAGWIGLNGLQLEECQCNMIGEESRTNFTHNNSNIMGGGDRELIRRCCDPKKLVVREAKFCERSTNDRSFICNGKLKLKDLKSVEEQKVSKIFNESQRVLKTDFAELAGNRDDKEGVSFTEHNEDLDIEEGQIVTEEPNMKDGLESENMASVHNAKKRNFCPENAPIRSTHKKVYDNKRILETLAKMEKRRERFKDPIALKREPDKSAKSQADLIVVTDEAKQDRPARKRRWNGS